jgi:type IV pilus assembly protein PilB
VRNLIFEQVASAELRVKARELGMRTLREDGVRKVVAGMTTLGRDVARDHGRQD